MIPYPGTPAANRLNAITSRQVAVVALHRLQELLHRHGVYTAVAYDDEQPQLRAKSDLTVWGDPEGLTFFWSTGPEHGRAERGPVAELENVAQRIASQVAEPVETPATAAL
ncbi:hypothetical protein FHR32_002099 [Streptosporangium album]|uniref:Uncharacterized protein n=1 Tax=Streptosporangium album TaxID=47479 RepID=A0A7W7RT98_9ACTN|nr:hypothetical protein [Streptosporangium album]MBB4937794.1 hypothetical protein [Streptosporangium album]